MGPGSPAEGLKNRGQPASSRRQLTPKDADNNPNNMPGVATDKYDGLTRLQWANRVMSYNPAKYQKALLIDNYTAMQLGKFQEGRGNLKKAELTRPELTRPDLIKKQMGATKTKAAATKGNKLEAEKLIRQIAAGHGIKINFVKCPGGVKPAPKAKAKEEEDSSDDDDSDLESCDSGDDE